MPRLIATPATADPVAAVPKPMITPASAGPTTRAELKAIELRAMALASRLRGTRSAANDWRTGMSTAFTRPSTPAIASTIQISTMPVAVIRKIVNACPAATTCVRDEQVSLLDAVGEDAAERREQHGRAELEDGDEAELERRCHRARGPATAG